MPGPPKRILFVDNHADERAAVAKHLQKAGYTVTQVGDGALAINKAIAERPDMVITAAEMPLVNGFKLCQLLRTNPMTRHIPFLFITDKETNPKKLGEFIKPVDDFILRPFKTEELLGRAHNLLYRLDKVQEVTSEGDRSVSGTLTEIALVDLLQIFKMNQKTGTLTLKYEGQTGIIFIQNGSVTNARIGKVSGEKAMFRLVAWQHGTFEFKPGGVPPEVRIHQATENLIMEGLRQFDEMNRLGDSLLPRKAVIKIKKKFKGPLAKLHPVTREVLNLLDFFSRVEEVLDNSTYPDLDIYHTLAALKERDIIDVTITEMSADRVGGPILALEDALKISYLLGVGRGEPSQGWTGKVLLFIANPALLENFIDKAGGIPEFHAEEQYDREQAFSSLMGVRGNFTVMENTHLQMLSIPVKEGLEPLWNAFKIGAIGALLLHDGDAAMWPAFTRATTFLRENKIPFAAFRAPGPAGTTAPDEGGKESWTDLEPADVEYSVSIFRGLFQAILAG